MEVSFDHVLKFRFVAINDESQADDAFVSMYIRILSQLWWNNLYRHVCAVSNNRTFISGSDQLQSASDCWPLYSSTQAKTV